MVISKRLHIQISMSKGHPVPDAVLSQEQKHREEGQWLPVLQAEGKVEASVQDIPGRCYRGEQRKQGPCARSQGEGTLRATCRECQKTHLTSSRIAFCLLLSNLRGHETMTAFQIMATIAFFTQHCLFWDLFCLGNSNRLLLPGLEHST